jgi:HSP20 family protein
MFTRWQPLGDVRAEMQRLQNEMSRLVGRFDLSDAVAAVTGTEYPALNVWEDVDNLYVEAELPGLELSDLEIYVNGSNMLSLQGTRKQPESGTGTWHRQERGFGKFSRVFELPTDVDADAVQATLKEGILMITLPKRAEAKPRRISVKVD